MHATEIDEPLFDVQSNSTVDKAVFIIFAHGSVILSKIRKVAESLGSTIFALPTSPQSRKEQLHECNARLDDVTSVLSNTNTTLHAELRVVADQLQEWGSVVRREKSIYHALNLFNYAADRKTLISEAWVPRNDLVRVGGVLESVGISGATPTMHELQSSKEPPTFHRTNKFTEEFQTIIDSYGVAKYREVNPAVASIVTFPFMFAVMFGDVGISLHALVSSNSRSRVYFVCDRTAHMRL
jgi:V-type H+-transporting ATPase subunit a